MKIIGYSNLIFQVFAPIIAFSDCLEISSEFMARIFYIFLAPLFVVQYVTLQCFTMRCNT